MSTIKDIEQELYDIYMEDFEATDERLDKQVSDYLFKEKLKEKVKNELDNT